MGLHLSASQEGALLAARRALLATLTKLAAARADILASLGMQLLQTTRVRPALCIAGDPRYCRMRCHGRPPYGVGPGTRTDAFVNSRGTAAPLLAAVRYASGCTSTRIHSWPPFRLGAERAPAC